MALRDRPPPAYSISPRSPSMHPDDDYPIHLPSVSASIEGTHPLRKIPTLEPDPHVSSPPASRNYSSPDPAAGAHFGPPHGGTLHQYHLSSNGQAKSSPTRAASIDAMSVRSSDERRRDPSVSMEDPDDRMAAEALCGLGRVGRFFTYIVLTKDSARSVTSQSGYETPLKYYPLDINGSHSAENEGPEPLLSLLTSSHPWLAGPINGSISAYSSTKSNSPRFIRYGADFVERTIGSPVVNTVGTVGRRTGVEGSLRRYLGERKAGEVEHVDAEMLGEQAFKRRRLSLEGGTLLQRSASGHTSIDTLPTYDENKSPEYEASEANRLQLQPTISRRPQIPRSWSTQLIISTSGLGAALNEASLRSLKFVLGMLRGANSHVTNLMEALKNILKEYDAGRTTTAQSELEAQSGQQPAGAAGNTFANRVRHLNDEIWTTLKTVVTTVSRYTGGALPENASMIVRWQLMSVPGRWRKAVSAHPEVAADVASDAAGENAAGPSASAAGGPGAAAAEKEALGSAHRMLAFAVEGIDMMEQVGGVVDSTILSAERWLESMGRKQAAAEQAQAEAEQAQAQAHAGAHGLEAGQEADDGDGDVHMDEATPVAEDAPRGRDGDDDRMVE